MWRIAEQIKDRKFKESNTTPQNVTVPDAKSSLSNRDEKHASEKVAAMNVVDNTINASQELSSEIPTELRTETTTSPGTKYIASYINVRLPSRILKLF